MACNVGDLGLASGGLREQSGLVLPCDAQPLYTTNVVIRAQLAPLLPSAIGTASRDLERPA